MIQPRLPLQTDGITRIRYKFWVHSHKHRNI